MLHAVFTACTGLLYKGLLACDWEVPLKDLGLVKSLNCGCTIFMYSKVHSGAKLFSRKIDGKLMKVHL